MQVWYIAKVVEATIKGNGSQIVTYVAPGGDDFAVGHALDGDAPFLRIHEKFCNAVV